MTNKTRDQLPESPGAAEDSTNEHDEAGEGTAFPIVGIGASAGGLEAFTELLRHLPLDTGMGFVLVQHLDPQHESALPQILARATALPVHEAKHKMRVEANQIYVIPPDANLSIAQGVLQLQPRPKSRTAPRSIDSFFEALAHDQQQMAIGIILSGTASDGTLGLEALKAAGGITFAQDGSAKYDSMPRSAEAAGCVDFILSPENIAKELARIARHPYVAWRPVELADSSDERPTTDDDGDSLSLSSERSDEREMPDGVTNSEKSQTSQQRAEGDEEHGFRKVMQLLHNHSGVDFSLYKASTIQRRITRRMVLNKHLTPDAYADSLPGNTKELDALYSDVLISVTSFFRNPEAFEVLTHTVFPKLFQRNGDDPIRVWVLGCSTGQEAYSIAMAFMESLEQTGSMRKLQMFATDLNNAVLEKARQGLYSKSLVDHLSPERLQRFFVEENGAFRVIKSLRETVVFARQNLIGDPPFSRMDLISCRNLLIYLEPGLQKKAIPTFHYALKPDGFLFLGASESIGPFDNLFEPADRKQKIYSKKAAPTPAFHFPVNKVRGESSVPTTWLPSVLSPRQNEASEGFRAELNAQREADRVTLSQFAPPGVLINDEMQILQFRGATGAYFEPPSGKASFDVLKMAREGLMLPLRAAISKAKKESTTVRTENVRVEEGDSIRTVNLEVIPLRTLKDTCYLILFQDSKQPGSATEKASFSQARVPRRRLSVVGITAKETSRRIEELEADLSEARDYLQSVQEQYEVANEELQAANEEGQSANEELQSLNEELETSKEELESANEELTTVNDEMAHRNAELNQLGNDMVNLQTSTKLPILLLGRDLAIRRFSAEAEKQFNLFATDIGRPIGNIRHNLVFAEHATRAASNFSVPQVLQLERPATGWLKRPAVRAPEAIPSPTNLEDFIADVIADVRERECDVRDTAGHWYSLRVHPYLTSENRVDGAVVVLIDINALKQSEQAIAASRDYAEAIVRTARDPLLILDAELRVHGANEAFYSTFHVSEAESDGRLIYDLGNGQWNIPRLRTLLEEILPQNTYFDNFEVTHNFKSLGVRSMLLNARMLKDSSGHSVSILLGIQDITERMRFQAQLRRSEERYRRLFEAAKDGVLIMDPGTRKILDSNPFMTQLLGYTRDELLGKELFEIGLLKDEAASRAAFQELKEKDFIRYDDLPLESKSGQRREVEMVSNVYEEDGEKVIQCNIRDITDRKQAERALREAGQKFRFLAESMPQKIFTAKANGDVDYLNPQWSELTGLPFEQMRDWGWMQFIHLDDVAANVSAWRHSIDTGEPFHFEHRFRQANGDYRWHLSRAVALKDSDSHVVMWVGSSTDVHEVKESDRRKNEFLAMLAHELRNPLAPIRNGLQILRLTGSNTETVRAASEMMERQVSQMVRLVDDLLDVSRISRGKIKLRRGRIELTSAVSHAVEATLALYKSMDHHLTVTLPPNPIFLDADPTRMAQIVGNLLNNACKFTERGGQISLTVAREGAQAIIRVRDSGIGISADQLPRIFDMFMQADTSLERSANGLGIGLTLVKNLVEMHGGTVEALSSGIGHGSEFVVRLPVAIDTVEWPPSEPAAVVPHVTTPRRVLVVDDNRDSAASLSMLLKVTGNETQTAFDGAEAVAVAETFRPDVVLLDIGLPILNGYDACRKIREQPWGQAMILIAVTGWGQDEDRRKSEESGFDGHLVKPVEFGALTTLLDELQPATGRPPKIARG